MKERTKKILIIAAPFIILWVGAVSFYQYRNYKCFSIAKDDYNYFKYGTQIAGFNTYLELKKTYKKNTNPTLPFNTTITFSDYNVAVKTFKGESSINDYYTVMYNQYKILLHVGKYPKTEGNALINTLEFCTNQKYNESCCRYKTLGQGYLGKYYATLIGSDITMCGHNFITYMITDNPSVGYNTAVTVLANDETTAVNAEQVQQMIDIGFSFADTLQFDGYSK